MRYVKHNTTYNLAGALKSNDMGALKDIIYNEIAGLIASYPFETAEALRNSGVSISDNPTQKELVKVIANNIGQNQKLKENLAKLILLRQNATKMLNANGVTNPWDAAAQEQASSGGNQTQNSGGDGQGWQTVVSIFGALFGGQGQQGAETTPKETESRISDMLKDRQPAKDNTGWIIAGVLGLGLIATIAVIYSRKKMAA